MSTRRMLARTPTALLTFIFIFVGMLSLHAQEQPPAAASAEPITTDRPAVTNSSIVVPSGSIQVENGFLETMLALKQTHLVNNVQTGVEWRLIPLFQVCLDVVARCELPICADCRVG